MGNNDVRFNWDQIAKVIFESYRIWSSEFVLCSSLCLIVQYFCVAAKTSQLWLSDWIIAFSCLYWKVYLYYFIMGKWTRYAQSTDWPTPWSKWMYPPKNVSTMQYIKTGFQTINKRLGPTLRLYKTVPIAYVLTCMLMFKLSLMGSKLILYFVCILWTV